MGRRQDIVEAAQTLFAERGYHHTSMQDLGDALGMQRGSLYAHIGSKDELLVEIVARAAHEFVHGMEQIVGQAESAPKRLQAALRHHIRVVTDSLPASAVFLFEWRHLPPHERLDVARQRDHYEMLWRRLLIEGVAEGAWNVQDPALTATFLLSIGNWTAQWYRPDGRLTGEQVADQIYQMAMDGISRRQEVAR
ncbi:MAG: TetR/AcrR family transcriptional regulator [Sulfobacillus sp.]